MSSCKNQITEDLLTLWFTTLSILFAVYTIKPKRWFCTCWFIFFFFRSWKIPWWLNITLCMFKKGEKRIILQTHQWHAQVNISSYAVFSCDNENRTFILKMPQNTHSNLSVNISKWLLDTADMLQHFTVNRTAVPLKATPFILTWALSCWGADFYK